jgi:hypothetical protein
MNDDSELPERRLFTTYERYDEFSNTQQSLLAIDLHAEPTPQQDKIETGLLQKLADIVWIHAVLIP